MAMIYNWFLPNKPKNVVQNYCTSLNQEGTKMAKSLQVQLWFT